MKFAALTFATLATALLITAPLLAQDAPAPVTATYAAHSYDYTPRVEWFLGYTHFGTGSTNATVGNRMVGLNGGSTSLALNFNRYFGLAADFGGYADSQLQLTGTGANQPFVANSSGSVYSYMLGPRLSFRNNSRFTPFAQALFGGVHASDVTVSNCAGVGCTPLPAQDTFAMTAGGGLDIALTRHVSLRTVQAEYMMTRFSDVNTGASNSQNDLRLSTGLLFRFGNIAPPLPLALSCSIQPQSVFPGDTITVVASASNLNSRHHVAYNWSTNGGVLAGTDSTVTISTTNAAPGSYAVIAHVSQGPRDYQQATCTASFTVQSPLPPAIACSASPSSLNSGDTSTITAEASSPQNRILTYSYSATAGSISGNTSTAMLSTSGAAPGVITVSCNVVDDRGLQASVTTTVTVMSPPVAALPATRNLCSISFDRDTKRPVRVDNEAKECLDDVALSMQRESTSRLVIVGNYSADEKQQAGADRAQNVSQYLTGDKGIDPSRIDLRSGISSGRTADNILVPVGATYTAVHATSGDATSPQ